MSSTTVAAYEALGYHSARPAALFGRGAELLSGEPVAEGGYMEGSIETLFGYGSVLGSGGCREPYYESLVSAPLFQTLVVVLLVAYLYTLLRSWSFVGSVWSGIIGLSSERRMASEGGELPLARFRGASVAIGVVLLALVGVRLADSYVATGGGVAVDGNIVVAMALLLVVAMTAWHYALHEIVGWITRSSATNSLSAIMRINLVRMVVMLFPLVGAWLLMPCEVVWIDIVLAVGSLLLMLIYLKDTFLFFIDKKISILYWILYLCTAILLPVSFVVVMVMSKMAL